MKKIKFEEEEKFQTLVLEFEDWRSKKRYAREPIPERLWSKAVALCKQHPISRVHRILSLSYMDLKKKVQKEKKQFQPIKPTSFVEL